MNKHSFLLAAMLLLTPALSAQDEITNAFDDLNRQGVVDEKDSEMRIKPSAVQLQQLLANKPAANYFCFTEDRMHDIRMKDAIPTRWIDRATSLRTQFNGEAAPGEFYTWQIGLFAPYESMEQVTVTFKTFKNEFGEKLNTKALRCFNQGGVDTDGNSFTHQITVPKGSVQPLWIGMELPKSARGTYKGTVTVHANNLPSTTLQAAVTIVGEALADFGDNEGWRKTRLRWLDTSLGQGDKPTAPYTPVKVDKQTIHYLGGKMELTASGLPKQITTHYTQSNQLDASLANTTLSGEAKFIIETASGIEQLKPSRLKMNASSASASIWSVQLKSKNFDVTCAGIFEFDGSIDYKFTVKAKRDIAVKDIRLELPYDAYASKYWMGLGNKGGLRNNQEINWQWNIDKHQDKIWMGNVNAGLNLILKGDNYTRPLVNIYYGLGKLNLPASWGNNNKGGIKVKNQSPETVLLTAYSGERNLAKGDILHYNANLLITPVKPLDLHAQATDRFYHSNSDISSNYIAGAKAAGATAINIHHKKDVYPYINYPYSDESVQDLKQFAEAAQKENLQTRLYYTTRELTVKIPELWALRSLGSEVIHDGPGKDARTLIHRNGPNKWLNENLTTNFIPAWYNAFNAGKYKGEMDISVITTPDSRWNNYYLAGLDWMIKNIGLGGVYIDDSALDRTTLQRARRILDADDKHRTIDIHSWNHNNQHAGYANSLHIYLELLPYVDRTWIGEGFGEYNTLDFWMVEMAGIPFGLMSETLDARNQFRGMVYGMLPRMPWSGNPVALWNLWDSFSMKDARMIGYWDEASPVKSNNEQLPATVYVNGDKALVVVANWTDMPLNSKLTIDADKLGFKPSKATLPQIQNLQWASGFNLNGAKEVMGKGGYILLLEK